MLVFSLLALFGNLTMEEGIMILNQQSSANSTVHDDSGLRENIRDDEASYHSVEPNDVILRAEAPAEEELTDSPGVSAEDPLSDEELFQETPRAAADFSKSRSRKKVHNTATLDFSESDDEFVPSGPKPVLPKDHVTLWRVRITAGTLYQ